MGGGSFDHDTYTRATNQRRSTGQDDFHYSKTASRSTPVHPTLDPMRINKKPFGKLESRDSAEHPESNAIFVCFDVTGSNINRARVAQKKLPNLFEMLKTYLPDPQLLFAANDDYKFVEKQSVQIGEFESDNRCDDQLRNIILTSEGGNNDGESYDLIMYAAAFKTVLDCYEHRRRKGYFFMYADEPIMTHVEAEEVHEIFGDTVQGRLPINAVINKLKEQYHVFVIWPQGGYDHARAQYVHLFGKECVLTLQGPDLICELIGSTIGVVEKKIKKTDVVKELVKYGTSSNDADLVKGALVHVS